MMWTNYSGEILLLLCKLHVAYQGRSQAIRWVGSLRTKSGPSNSFYNYGDFKTCMS